MKTVNTKGFSLIETMISMSIVIIVMAAMTQTTAMMSKQNATMEDRLSKLQLRQLLMTNFQDQQACYETFKTRSLAQTFNGLSILDGNGNPLLRVGDVFDSLAVTDIEVQTPNPTASSTNIVDVIVYLSSQRNPNAQILPI